MSRNRKRYSASFKANAVLELLSKNKTLNDVATKYEIDPVMLSKWKRIFLESSSKIFENPRKKDVKPIEKKSYMGYLEKKVNQLSIERDWLKKNINSLSECDHKRKLSLVDVNFNLLSISRQTELLGISRSSYYYKPIENLEKRIIHQKIYDIL